MRRLTAGLLALAGLTGTAFAADLSGPNPTTTKAPIPASTINWSGFYVGVNAGGGWYGGNGFVGGGNVGSLVPATNIINVPSTASQTAAAFTAGGLAGYNLQFGSFVLGAETDFNDFNSRSDRSGSTSIRCCETFLVEPTAPVAVTSAISGTGGNLPVRTFVPPGIHLPPGIHPLVVVPIYATETLTHASKSQLDWFGTARVRFGYVPTPRLLVYGTGGLAYGEVQGNLAWSNVFSTLSPRDTGKAALRTLEWAGRLGPAPNMRDVLGLDTRRISVPRPGQEQRHGKLHRPFPADRAMDANLLHIEPRQQIQHCPSGRRLQVLIKPPGPDSNTRLVSTSTYSARLDGFGIGNLSFRIPSR